MKSQDSPAAAPPSGAEPAFAELMSFRLHTLAKLVDQHAEARHRAECGLGLLECRVIGVVGAQGPLAFKDLCERAELEKSNASRIVARLVASGHVERRDDPHDQRSFFVLPTAAGRRLRLAIHRSAAARNEHWLSVLSPRQRRALSSGLARLTEQARGMLGQDMPASSRAVPRPDEAPRITWIDRRLAEQLHALLGSALGPAAPGPAPVKKGAWDET